MWRYSLLVLILIGSSAFAQTKVDATTQIKNWSGSPAFLKSTSSDAIQYVSPNGNDSNDGLSWGTAKATVFAACESLPGGATSPPTCGKGTIYFTSGASAHPTAGCGFWLMSSLDPNYSSPPTCWLRSPTTSGAALSLIGVTSHNAGPNAHMGRALLNGGSGADTNHPLIWISGNSIPLYIANLSGQYPGRGIVIGECSNNVRTGTCGSNGITFFNDTVVLNAVSGNGPDWDITGNSFWIWMDHCGGQGLSMVNTPTNDNAAAVLIDGRTNPGNGLIFISNMNVTNGGIKFYAGANGGQLLVKDLSVEAMSVSAVWFATQPTQAKVDGVSTADSSSIFAVENDGPGPADSLVVSNLDVNAGGVPPTSGPMVVQGFATTVQQNTVISPTRNQQEGFEGGRVIGQTDTARRAFGPVAVRFTNLASATPTTDSGSGTVTTGVTAPDGTTNAITLAASSGVYNAKFYRATITPTVGDWLIGGAWVRQTTGNGYYSATDPLDISLTGTNTLAGKTYGSPPWKGDGDWEWVWCAAKVTATSSNGDLIFDARVSTTTTTSYYGPVLLNIPAGTISDNEAWEIATNLQSYASNCSVGTICGLAGQELVVPAFGTLKNCSVNSASPASCGSAASGSFVVPTTTTSYTVNTTAVTAHSRIFIVPVTDASDLPSSPKCNAPASGYFGESARSAGTSFTFTLPSTSGTTCWNYWIMN